MARLVTSFLLLSVLTVGLVAVIAYARARETLKQSLYDQLRASATLKEDELNRWVDDQRRTVDWISQLTMVQYQADALTNLEETNPSYRFAHALLSKTLADMAASKPDLKEVFVLDDADGRIILSTDKTHEGQYRSSERYFVQACKGIKFVQNIYATPGTGKPQMTIAVPLLNGAGQRVGVLAAHLDLKRMDKIVLEHTGLGETAETYLVDQQHRFVTAERFGRDEVSHSVHSAGIDSATQGQSGAGLYRNYDGEPVIGVYRWIPRREVALLAEMHQSEAFALARQLAKTILLVGLVSAGVLTVGVFLLARQIARPILAITETAIQVTAGGPSREAPVMTEDEIGVLANAFNTMQSALRRSHDRLEEYAHTLEQRVAERTLELQQANQALSRRALQLETSSEVGQQITSILDLNELLSLVVDLVQKRFRYYFVGVWLLSENKDFAILRAGTGEAGASLRQQEFCLPTDAPSIAAQVYKTGTYRAVEDVDASPDYLALDELPDVRSELILPLQIGQEIIGSLHIASDRQAAFGPDDVMVMQILANQIAITIRNARLYRGEKRRRQFAESLEQIGRTLSSSLDMRQVPRRILDQLAIVVPYDRGSVLLRRGDNIRLIAHRGFPDDGRANNLHIPIRRGDVFQQLTSTRQPLVIKDVTREAGWQQLEWLPVYRSWLGVPLVAKDRVIGMISLLRREAAQFSSEDARLVMAFAGQAAIALENARLYDHLEEAVQKRTEALRAAYDQLERLDRTKTDFISVAAHELRTPLTVLRGYSQMLLNDRQVQKSAKHQQLISGIHAGTMRLHSVVDSMLDIAKIDSRALELLPEPLYVPALIHQLVSEKLAEPLSKRKLTLKIEDMNDLPAIEADPDALHKVFYHLIVNAIKYTPDGGKITVAGRVLDNAPQNPLEGKIEIVVSDTGIGIAPEVQELIFTKFYQTGPVDLHSTGKTKFKGGGAGLGLAVAHGIVEAHGGELWVESPGYDEEACPGSCFHVVLPLRQKASQGGH